MELRPRRSPIVRHRHRRLRSARLAQEAEGARLVFNHTAQKMRLSAFLVKRIFSLSASSAPSDGVGLCRAVGCHLTGGFAVSGAGSGRRKRSLNRFHRHAKTGRPPRDGLSALGCTAVALPFLALSLRTNVRSNGWRLAINGCWCERYANNK